MPENQFEVGPDQDGQRIDNYLLARLRGVPRSRIYRMIRGGEVRINGGRVRPQRRVTEGDLVRVPPWAARAEPARPARVRDLGWLDDLTIYEDEELLVLDKPAGLAVHGGSGVSLGLIEALRAHRSRARFLELVHRLDRDTSGLIMVALKRRALVDLHARLREGGIRKYYLALVAGRWPRGRPSVDVPLSRNVLRSGERVVRVDASGQPALTRFRILQAYPRQDGPLTLVEAAPVTGRTHQIRVHCCHAGAPVVGDPKYGGEKPRRAARQLGLSRMCLHASRLEIPDWQGRGDLVLEAPLPDVIDAALAGLES